MRAPRDRPPGSPTMRMPEGGLLFGRSGQQRCRSAATHGDHRAHCHARYDPAHHHHRLLSATALVRPQPGRPIVQDRARRFPVPRAISRRGRQHHRRAGSGGARYRDGRRQPLRPDRGRQVLVLLPDRASRRRQRPSRHLAWMDVAPRPASRQDPVGGAGGLSAGRRARKAHARPARIHRALAGRPAHDGPAGEIRRHLRPRPRRRCCGTSSTTTTRR